MFDCVFCIYAAICNKNTLGDEYIVAFKFSNRKRCGRFNIGCGRFDIPLLIYVLFNEVNNLKKYYDTLGGSMYWSTAET